MKQVIVLDFDGVICDSLKECLLISWNSWQRKSPSAFSPQGVADIPQPFLDRFQRYRSFSRHLGHFFVALGAMEDEPRIETQQEFEDYYASLDQKIVSEFVVRATAYRAAVRQERRQVWLDSHVLYYGMQQVLISSASAPLYIVTARDRASVQEVLQSKAIPFAPEHIFGEQTDKLAALRTIEQRERMPPIFVDDHLSNVLSSRRAGYQTWWAVWGYHAPEHEQTAHTHGIKALNLDEFMRRMDHEGVLSEKKKGEEDAQ
jgi:phosphoglycolate phosphatase-like HAD superfamily hydrolase